MGAVNKTIGLEYVMLSNLEPSGFERMPGIHLKNRAQKLSVVS